MPFKELKALMIEPAPASSAARNGGRLVFAKSVFRNFG